MIICGQKYFLIIVMIIMMSGIKLASAQDKIIFTNGTELKAKITEITEKQVSYKLFDNQNGPLYIVNKTEIATILYENGQTEIFSKIKVDEPKKPDLESSFKKNIVGIHVSDFIYLNYTMSVERLSNDGYIGVQIPFSMGITNNTSDPFLSDFTNVFYTGLGLKYYPQGQKTFSYFFGPSAIFGWAESRQKIFTNNEDYDKASYTKILFNNGFLISPTRSFCLELNLGLGCKMYNIYYKVTDNDYSDLDGITRAAYFSFMLGFKM